MRIIEGLPEGAEYDVAPSRKRFTLPKPVTFEADCPSCGRPSSSVVGGYEDPIDYASVGPSSREPLPFLCDTHSEGCGHEWEEHYRIRLFARVELASDS